MTRFQRSRLSFSLFKTQIKLNLFQPQSKNWVYAADRTRHRSGLSNAERDWKRARHEKQLILMILFINSFSPFDFLLWLLAWINWSIWNEAGCQFQISLIQIKPARRTKQKSNWGWIELKQRLNGGFQFDEFIVFAGWIWIPLHNPWIQFHFSQ